MTSQVTIQKEIEILKRALGFKPTIIIEMWRPDRCPDEEWVSSGTVIRKANRMSKT